MTPPIRPEARHLDPDPRYVEPDLEPVRRLRDVESAEEQGAISRLAATIGCFAMLVLFATGVVVSLLTAPRGGPDGPEDSRPARLGAPLPDPPISVDAGAPLDTAIAGPLWAGTATWYCSSSSACTAGYGPSDLVAAIDSDLGIGKGERVTVRFGKHEVTVRIVDVCACAGERLIDLTSGAFRRLAPLSAGVLPVTIEVVGSTSTLPPTDVEP